MSLIALSGSDFHDPLEQLLHDLAERVDSVVDGIARESQQFRRYEEPTTSRLAQAINDAIRHHPITAPGLALDVHAEEFTKRQEKVAGAEPREIERASDDVELRVAKIHHRPEKVPDDVFELGKLDDEFSDSRLELRVVPAFLNLIRFHQPPNIELSR
jgi:hypothetical protein